VPKEGQKEKWEKGEKPLEMHERKDSLCVLKFLGGVFNRENEPLQVKTLPEGKGGGI